MPKNLQRARLLGRAAAVAVLALVAAACSSTDKGAKPAALTPVAAPIAIQRVWEYDVGSGEGAFLRPAVVENAIYAASRDGDLVRLDPATGHVVWKTRIEGGIGAGVGSDGSALAVVGPRGNIVVMDASGKRLWDAQASSDVTSRPLVGHDLVIIRSTDQRIAAYEISTGKRRWVFQRQQPALALRAEADIAFAGDNVVVGFPGGRMSAIALSNGAGRWDAGVSEPTGATEVERLADVMGVPGLHGDEVCTASYQGRIACFDARNGDLHWAREFNASAGVAISADAVYGVDASAHVNAFKRDGGAGLWQNSALSFRGLSAPVVVGRYLALADFEGYVHFLSLQDGSIVGRIELGGGRSLGTPQSWNGAALFQMSRGRLVLLQPAG